MSLFRWTRGRQQGNYEKMLLARSQLLRFDLYVLRFPPGSYIPPHRDPVQVGRHYRLNVILKAPRLGGRFVVRNAILNWPRVKLFRPDISEHEVTRVVDGTRYVLSFGLVLGR